MGSTNTSPLLAAVLSSSRSVEVGSTRTAFATINNGGSSAAGGCAIAPVTSVPASFVYQATNSAINALMGSTNTPVSITGGSAELRLAKFCHRVHTQRAVRSDQCGARLRRRRRQCSAGQHRPHTFLLSASATPVPDVVALPATAQNDASCALLLAISLCKTNPMSGQCISSISSSVTTTINRPRTSRFSQRPAARVPFVPRPNRTLVEFGHANSVVRGATGVAIEMQSDPRIIPVGLPRQP